MNKPLTITALLLAGLLWACSDDADPAPAADAATPTPDSANNKDFGLSPCAYSDPFCKGSEPACLKGGQICRCLSVCSGVKPRPGQEYSWRCAAPPPAACPAAAPKTGAACAKVGLKCTYGHCPVTRASCGGGKWTVKTDPLPP